MIAAPEQINHIDLEVAERMADNFREEANRLPDNSELKRPMTRAVVTWERIAETLRARL